MTAVCASVPLSILELCSGVSEKLQASDGAQFGAKAPVETENALACIGFRVE